MKASCFKALVESWDSTLGWKKTELESACTLLADISRLNAGQVLWDCDKDIAAEESHALEQARLAIQARVTMYARNAGKDEQNTINWYSKKSKEFSTGKKQLIASTFARNVDLNEASLAELAELPGLGPKTAKRIMEFRQKVGRLTDVSDVRAVQGIGQAQLEKFRDKVYVSQQPARYRVSDPAELRFLREPTFSSYLGVLEANGRAVKDVESIADAQGSVCEAILRELEWIRDDLASSPAAARNSLGVLGSTVLNRTKWMKRAIEIANDQPSGPCVCSVVSNSQYLDFVKWLITDAKKSVKVAMFFLVFDKKNKKYPINELVEALVRAHKQGVSVQVVLDRDQTGEKYGSRSINRPAYQYLKGNGVQVKFDRPERALHSKVIIVDGTSTIVGSHNWTAGSIYQYDDKSIFFKSSILAKKYEAGFDELWTEGPAK